MEIKLAKDWICKNCKYWEFNAYKWGTCRFISTGLDPDIVEIIGPNSEDNKLETSRDFGCNLFKEKDYYDTLESYRDKYGS